MRLEQDLYFFRLRRPPGALGRANRRINAECDYVHAVARCPDTLPPLVPHYVVTQVEFDYWVRISGDQLYYCRPPFWYPSNWPFRIGEGPRGTPWL